MPNEPDWTAAIADAQRWLADDDEYPEIHLNLARCLLAAHEERERLTAERDHARRGHAYCLHAIEVAQGYSDVSPRATFRRMYGGGEYLDRVMPVDIPVLRHEHIAPRAGEARIRAEERLAERLRAGEYDKADPKAPRPAPTETAAAECTHPESMRIKTLSGPGSFYCAACNYVLDTLSAAAEPSSEPAPKRRGPALTWTEEVDRMHERPPTPASPEPAKVRDESVPEWLAALCGWDREDADDEGPFRAWSRGSARVSMCIMGRREFLTVSDVLDDDVESSVGVPFAVVERMLRPNAPPPAEPVVWVDGRATVGDCTLSVDEGTGENGVPCYHAMIVYPVEDDDGDEENMVGEFWHPDEDTAKRIAVEVARAMEG